MKKSLLLTAGFLAVACYASAESVTLNGKDYEINTLIDYDLGPGVRYTRLRVPAYPLNVNMLRIDVTNPYNSVEVQQASEKLYSTESLVTGAKRNSKAGHVALAGANANFWCVSGQPPYSDQLIGVTYNGNLKNGKIITETNCKNDKYNGGLAHTGITGISTDNKVYSSNNFSWVGSIMSDVTGELEIYQCNKIVRDEEIGLYNSFYPSTRTFRCCDVYYDDASKKNHFSIVPNCATEVYLSMDAGQEWSAGDNMVFTVKEVKTNAGAGTIGSYDLALVGRGSKAVALAKLKAGDKVTVNYSWIDPNGNRIKMNNLVGGNAQVLVNNELTKYNDSEAYNSQIYSRTGYGCDAEGKTLYIIVIDKATDPTYGSSAGCPTKVMCELAMHYGCSSMTNYDAGGSAMMMVGDKIINKTTEANPRAVANGMVAYSTAPEDNEVKRLEFYDYELKSPIYASSSPRIIAYNQYGAIISDDFTGATLSCPEEAGTCEGQTFTAGGKGMETTLTATYNGVSVTKPIKIFESEMSIRVKPLHIDYHRQYPVEVTALVDDKTYYYDPAVMDWTISDENVVNIDEKGILTGVSEGVSEISCAIGTFSDKTTVTVEEANAALMPIDGSEINPEDWKITYSSTKNGVITPSGTSSGFGLDFNITNTRAPKITLSKDVKMYSLPDAIEITVNPGTTSIKNIMISLQPANESRAVSYTYEETMPTSTDTKIVLPIDEFGDSKDLATYPVVFKSIAFTLNGPTGNTHLDVKSIHGVYNNFTDGVDGIIADGIVNDGKVHYYNLNGTEASAEQLLPGLYIKVADGKAEKITVK